jgi:hypothetical protein
VVDKERDLIDKLPLLHLDSDQLKETVLILTAIARNEKEKWLVISALDALMRLNSAEIDQAIISIIKSRWRSSPEEVGHLADICHRLGRRDKIKTRELIPILLVFLEEDDSWQTISAVAEALQQIATSSDHQVIAALQKARTKIQIDIKSVANQNALLSIENALRILSTTSTDTP